MAQKRDIITEQELQWFFCRSSADVGIKSNFSAMINAGIYGGSSCAWEDPNTEFQIRSVAKLRHIEQVFYKLSVFDQKALYVINSHVRIHPFVEKILGRLGGISYMLLDADKLEKLCTKANSGILTGPEKILISKFRVQQEKIYNKALLSYQDLKQLQLNERTKYVKF